MKSKIIFILASLVLLSGCESFLDVEPKTFYTSETYYQKPEHAKTAVSACYALLRRPYRGVGTYGESPFMMLEFATGMCQTSVGQAAYSVEFQEARAADNNSYAWDWWQSYYEGIENCNIAIEKIPGTPQLGETDKSHYLGEVHFLRAYYYFKLVQMYGDVPLRNTRVTSADGINMARTPIADVYNQIVADLTVAEKSKLPNTSTSGRITMGAVKSLFAKVYLTMAGYPLQKKELYAEAAKKAEEVITNKWYKLFPKLDDLRDRSKRNTVEHIFQTQYAVGIEENQLHPWLLPRYSGISSYSNEYGCFYPDSSFIRSYNPNDKRVQDKGFFYNNYPKWGEPSTIIKFPAHIYKFFDDAAMGNNQGAQNYPNLRYADILLVYAEAINEAEGKPNNLAIECYNLVRARAGFTDVTASDFANQNDFREAVWKERYWELCFENQTWFDMARTRKVFDLKTYKFSDFVGYVLPYGKGAFKFTEKQLLFPIPLRDRQTNPNLTQNFGY